MPAEESLHMLLSAADLFSMHIPQLADGEMSKKKENVKKKEMLNPVQQPEL